MSKNKEEEDVLLVKKQVIIEAGIHEGKITNVVRNPPTDENKYDYIDIYIELSDMDDSPELRAGYPANISELSALGRLIKRAGMDFSEGEEIKVSDIKDLITDREITFLSNNEKTEYGEFARVIRETIEFTK